MGLSISMRAYYFLCLFLMVNLVDCLKKPNIVLIITDDQDSVMGGMTPMKKTEKLLGKHGVTFPNSYTSAPICCPSRSSILTGMYPHNHHTTNNSISGGCSSTEWQQKFEPKTFPVLLQEAKYRTFYAGKYLNQYGEKNAGGPAHIPNGWNEWRGLIGNSKYYNFTLSENGIPVHYKDGEYLTEIITSQAVKFLKEESKNDFANPLLLVLAPPAPHAPFLPADKYKDTFHEIHIEKTPNFNIPAGEDKHWLLQMPPSPLPNSMLDKLEEMHKNRWRTLLSVDDMVEELFKELESHDILNNTYIIFTSDNGYHLGQFSQPFDKRQPYETDIKVPLLIKGPKIAPNTVKSNPTVNIDIAPTILQLAGVKIPDDMDGLPLPIFEYSEEEMLEFSLKTNSVEWLESYDRQILIEYHGEGSHPLDDSCSWRNDTNLFGCSPDYFCKCQDSKNNTYGCVRHLHPSINFIYCSFNDTQSFEEAYDLSSDPFQLKNIISEMMPAIKFKYQNMLEHLSECRGSSCRIFDDFL